MPFSQSTITEVYPPRRLGGQAFLSWASSSPAGTWYQVYVNQKLAWFGRRLSVWIPIPQGPVRIDIGAVGNGEQQTSFASSLPSSPTRCARLTWLGGTYQASDIAGFHIYGEPAPGYGIDEVNLLADITAYPGGILTNGFGLGGFGLGGLGDAASAYSWASGPLSSGTWTFAVKSYDAAGNEGMARTVAVTINAPPRSPAPFSDGSRLKYIYDSATKRVTLSWNPSPT